MNNSFLSPEFSRVIEKILTNKSPSNENEEDLKNYIKLILTIARSYVRTRVEYEDLVMAGVIGLLEARKNYDVSRSPNFKAYAGMCIMGNIYQYCHNNSRLLSVPTHIAKASWYIEKIYRLLSAATKDTLTQEELDEMALNYNNPLNGLSEEFANKVRHSKDRINSIARNSSQTYEKLAIIAKESLVSTVSDAALSSWSSGGPSTEEIVSRKEIQEGLIRSLGHKRFKILQLHYEGYNNPDIAQKIKLDSGAKRKQAVSRSAVKNMKDNAIDALKNMEIFHKEYKEKELKDEGSNKDDKSPRDT